MIPLFAGGTAATVIPAMRAHGWTADVRPEAGQWPAAVVAAGQDMRLSMISQLFSQVSYKPLLSYDVTLPKRRLAGGYIEPGLRLRYLPTPFGGGGMTTKSAFSPADWQTVLEGPPTAGLIVVTAARGGTIRETIAMAQAYTEARNQHGESQLLDEIVAAKPKLDHTRFHSPDELKEHGLAQLREAASLVGNTATPAELDEYRHFVVTLASKVAEAHREHGQQVSPAETAAIKDITAALGAAGG